MWTTLVTDLNKMQSWLRAHAVQAHRNEDELYSLLTTGTLGETLSSLDILFSCHTVAGGGGHKISFIKLLLELNEKT